MKVILDVDPGVDDAVAMGMVLSRDDIELLAVTCVRGNAEINQVTKNALKIIQAFDRDDVKVYKGCTHGIIKSDTDGIHWHGADGMANVHHYEPDFTPLQDEHAVSAINRLAGEHPGELTLICLGPLTNLALALRLNENLSKQLKEVVIMGGNYKGVGNVTMAAEFNFYCDPISARIVLGDVECPKYLVTWELSKQNFLSLDDIGEYCGHDNKKSKFMKKMIDFFNFDADTNVAHFCDSVAVAVAINREIITKSFVKYATVDIESSLTKGAVVIGWNPEFDQTDNNTKKENVIIIDEIDVELYRKLFLESVQ